MAATSLTGITTENKLDIKSFLDLVLPPAYTNPPTEEKIRVLFAEYLSGIVSIYFPRPVGKKNSRIHVFVQFISPQVAKLVKKMTCGSSNHTPWGWLVGFPTPNGSKRSWPPPSLSPPRHKNLYFSPSSQPVQPTTPSQYMMKSMAPGKVFLKLGTEVREVTIPLYDPDVGPDGSGGVATKSTAAMTATSTFLPRSPHQPRHILRSRTPLAEPRHLHILWWMIPTFIHHPSLGSQITVFYRAFQLNQGQ
ncbi:hypothetical protein BS47DRAFT_1399504 [Hydnum rufescens UP504]|uniref:Uncharacterized protein n=1 Tax=Hydnum rufescens UP504 TaxID=1448309 RepID=A0A9P6AKC6_9AGAM|nr:hypothetical protein BS47DRAFT_1399504 [Hydnum rufescens UP504]